MPDDVTSLQIRVATEEVAEASRRLTALEQRMGSTERETDKLGRSATSLGKAWGTAGRVMVGALSVIGIGLGGVTASMGAATQAWLQYDKAMKEVNSITAQTRAQFGQMRGDVLRLASAIGVDATVAAKGLYQAISAGVPRENAMTFLETAAKASIAGVTSVDVAVDGLTNTINAFKIPVSEAESVADKLFATVVYGKTTFEELSVNLSKASVPAAALGVDLNELLAAVVAITAQGTPTAEAFTQIKATITALLDPSDELAAVYKQLGVESGRQAIAQFGLVDTLQAVRSAYDGNDSALVKALRSSEAYNGVLSMTGANLNTVKKATDDVRDSSGSMGKAFKENSATLENALNSLKSSSISLVEQMESSFGVIGKFTELLRDAAVGIQQLSGDAISNATASAMSLGGVGGANSIAARMQELGALKQELLELQELGKNAISAENGGLDGRLSEAGFPHFNPILLRSVKDELERINGEMARLDGAYQSIDSSTHDQALSLERIKVISENTTLSEERKAELIAAEHAALDEKVRIQESSAAWAKKDLELAATRAEQQRNMANDALLGAKEEERVAKEKEKYLDEAAESATRLATTDRERLELQKAQVEEALKAGRISEEIAGEALFALDEQIAKLDELNGKRDPLNPVSGSGGGFGGSATSTRPTASFGTLERGLTDIDNPFNEDNEIERLRRQEEQVRESYEKRREDILELTSITEEQRLALLQDAENKYLAIMEQSNAERRKATLDSTGQFFDDIASIGSAFGKKGAKVAKAAAIASATITMYDNATKAYGRGLEIPYIGAYVAPVFAGAALAAGAANIAKINSTDNAGAYEHGGMIPSGKVGLVGEAGPEFIRGPATVSSARTTAGLLGGPSGNRAPQVNVTVNNNAPVSVEERVNSNGDIEFFINEIARRLDRGGDPLSRTLERIYPQMNRGANGRM